MNEQRKTLKIQYRELYEEIESILFKHDPIEINYEDNTDEYDPEVDTILPRLKTAKSEVDVLNIVHEEFCKWFDEDQVGSIELPVYKDIAKDVWEAWERHERISD